MADWNTLFLDDANRAYLPQPEVYKFIKMLESKFDEASLNIWDSSCGAGRHSVLTASLGHKLYASDHSTNAIDLTREWLSKENLSGSLVVKDMTESPWTNVGFHGVFSWDAIHHNTYSNIEKAVELIRLSLVPGGLFMATLCSTNSRPINNRGKEVESNTYIRTSGAEEGVLHHYFDREELRRLFSKWRLVMLLEMVSDYQVSEEEFHKMNPFVYTKWAVIVERI